MANITLGGTPTTTIGELPEIGSLAPSFIGVRSDLSAFDSELDGKNIIINIFASIDTGICADSTRKFNEKVSTLTTQWLYVCPWICHLLLNVFVGVKIWIILFQYLFFGPRLAKITESLFLMAHFKDYYRDQSLLLILTVR